MIRVNALTLALYLAGLPALAAPSVRNTVGERKGESALVPSNQVVTPLGTVRRVNGARPKDVAVSPNGKVVAVLTQNAVLLYTPLGQLTSTVPLSTGPLGLAWAPNSASLYATGDEGQVNRISIEKGAWKKTGTFKLAEVVEAPVSGSPGARTNSPNGTDLVPLPAPTGNPQVTGLALSPDGKRLYAALGIRNALLVVNTSTWKTIAKIPVGVAPYRIALSPNGRTLLVANRGGRAARSNEPSAPSAQTQVRVDPTTDSALGGSLTFIDTHTLKATSVDAGRQPSAAVFTRDGSKAYVANSDGDSISIVDIRLRRIAGTISMRQPEDPGFGQMPTSLALSADGNSLYVACGGANAVAIVSTATRSITGYLPTGWFPIALGEHGGRLFVASTKGFGSRLASPVGGYNVHSTVGTVQFIARSDWRDLALQTRKVAENNRWGRFELPARKGIKPRPVPERVGEPSVFKHVVYIIKENHTYDLDLGDMPEGNGDKALCLFPERTTPNEHAIARQFVLLDNTYTSGTNSADGHQWTGSAVANAYMEQNYSAYARSYPYDGGDPLAYSPAGFLWTSAVKKHRSVRVYGEFVNKPRVVDPSTGKEPTFRQFYADYKAGGNRYKVTADTDNAALKPLLHPKYIGWPVIPPDQWRADLYLKDLSGWQATGKMPDLSILLLPCNHTNGTDPGYPTPRASVADNDLALGRIVEGISKSRFWKDTLILVIEDDSQFGLDHVDGHRTVAFCASAYTRRGKVVSEVYNHTSLIRTMGLVLGLPAMNRFDRTATPMSACFTAKPEYSPYTAVPTNVPIDEMNPSTTALNGEARRLALASHKLDWSGVDRADATIVARAVWHSLRPDEPFPWAKFHPNVDED
ncbi:MAG TPA: alkaline phosphatase family protein [Armatimonadota bacterium]|jgi:YVTN family beta-propeller protein